jgi:hypothetical protein
MGEGERYRRNELEGGMKGIKKQGAGDCDWDKGEVEGELVEGVKVVLPNVGSGLRLVDLRSEELANMAITSIT